jgi:Flp pilus assembly pilin Flp
MMKRLKRFSTAEQGAVTVDWVVLTAAVVALAAGIAAVLLAPGDAGIATILKGKITSAIDGIK